MSKSYFWTPTNLCTSDAFDGSDVTVVQYITWIPFFQTSMHNQIILAITKSIGMNVGLRLEGDDHWLHQPVWLILVNHGTVHITLLSFTLNS